MQDLLEVARRRKNVVPVMADAAQPEQYAPLVETVDLVYQDVSQPGQAAIALRNRVFLRDKGTFILMLKTRSVDVFSEPEAVFSDTVTRLADGGLAVLWSSWLVPYHRDHAAIVLAKK
jgi:fibrillarin-like pre-rRNA processing protein